MSWHISNALMRAYANSPCSQGQEAASLVGTCSDGAACAPSNGSLTPLLYLPPDRTKAFSRLSRSGMTFGALTEPLGAALLTWYRAGFRVRTSAAPEREQASKASGPACGKKWRGSLAKYDPDTCSWRTAQFSLLGGLELFSETWPRWGTMRSGECSERTTPVLRIEGKESGYSRLFPTPTCNAEAGMSDARKGNREPDTLGECARQQRWPIANTPSGNWPTPTCADAFTDKLQSSQQQEGSMHSVNLSQAVRMWPTPLKSDYNPRISSANWTGTSDLPSVVTAAEEANGNLQPQGGGSLNPTWVEWLMGWPIGWTDLKLSGTDKCPPSWCSHGKPCKNAFKCWELKHGKTDAAEK